MGHLEGVQTTNEHGGYWFQPFSPGNLKYLRWRELLTFPALFTVFVTPARCASNSSCVAAHPTRVQCLRIRSSRFTAARQAATPDANMH